MLHLKDCFGMEFTTWSGELMSEEVLISFTTYLTHIASFRSGIVIEVRK